MDQDPQMVDGLFVDPRFLHQALEEAYMTDTDLEIGQSRSQQHVIRHGDDLCICVRRSLTDQFRADLGVLLQSSPVLLMVYKSLPQIAQAHRSIHIQKVSSRCPGNGRCKVGPEHKRIAFPVKELVQIPGGNRSDIAAKDIKIFESRSLYIPVTVGGKDIVKLLFHDLLAFTFIAVYIPKSFRCMQDLLIHKSLRYCLILLCALLR